MEPVEIARIEERRQALSIAAVAPLAEEIAGGRMCFAGPGSWANQAAGLGLDGPVSDAEIDRLVDFYVSRATEPKLELCPFAHETLVHGLAARGFRVREFENILARGCDDLPDVECPAEIVRVDPADEAGARLFIELSTSGFRPADEPVPEALFALAKAALDRPFNDSYVARWNGEPAGAGSLEHGDGGAALCGTSVLPRFRRRGIQAALIRRRLERARERGCRIVCIHSRPGIPTERNAIRLGFAMAYTKAILFLPGEGLRPSP